MCRCFWHPAVLAGKRRPAVYSRAARATRRRQPQRLLCLLHRVAVATVTPAPQLAATLERDPLLDDFGDEDATVLAAMFGDPTPPLSYRRAAA
jgi:hypothetical protein